MPDDRDVVLKIRILQPEGNFLGGTFDIVCQHRALGERSDNRGLSASGEIDLAGLRRAPNGDYTVTVTPHAKGFDPQSQFVTIPASGATTVQFVFPASDGAGGQGSGASDHYEVQGTLTFDYALPAADVSMRFYSVGFAGQDVRLGETKSDSQGNYSFAYNLPKGQSPNLQVRALESNNQEVTISKTKFNAQQRETLNLVVPGNVQPLAPEFQRLSSDIVRHVGAIANLGQAQENGSRQDLTLLNRANNWDARLIAMAATAAQQTTATGLGQDVLYALFRLGLPTGLQYLAMVQPGAIQTALTKANQAGIVSLTTSQVTAATGSFQMFASQFLTALPAPGGVSTFGDLFKANIPDPAQQAAFANLYFSQPSAGAAFWQQAANLNIPTQVLNALKLQGRFLSLTFNNGRLAQALQQQIESIDNLSQLAEKDYYGSAAWKNILTSLAGTDPEALDKLIPTAYQGAAVNDRLDAYAADMARKVRIGFPTHVVARMLEKSELPVDPSIASQVGAFVRTAAMSGYEMGRTPLNKFLNSPPTGMPALDEAGKSTLKTLHRLYQVTPSAESLQTTLKLGFTSAYDIAAYQKNDFMDRFAGAFPSPVEASKVHRKAQQIAAVTLNVFVMAKQLDTAPPVYALSPPDPGQNTGNPVAGPVALARQLKTAHAMATVSASLDGRQNAKTALVQQFPTMETLFGSLDFCSCDDCQSVLSPAAYFVDLLEFLRTSERNANGNSPLDVLIGSKNVTGRRADLGALPLTCENTNTALPYIDLVNEILEYAIAYQTLDAGAAYDTGTATTADLLAEPQHIQAEVYTSTLNDAVYPLALPFDLWIETVRGFLNYLKSPLVQVLEGLRPEDNLELFTDGNQHPYYRAQIFAESLGLAPAEYGVLVGTKPPPAQWYKLYGYADNKEQDALNDLKSAKILAQKLGLTYQEVTDLVTTGFLNPALNALVFQFRRFGISMDDAFSYTNQPGFLPLADTTAFETLLNSITERYKKQNQNQAFDAKTWLSSVLPANYSQKVLVLYDPDTGCDFTGTTLQYADNESAATPLDFLKVNLFVRLWKKLGWTMDETDRALQLFFPSNLPDWNDPGFADAFSSAWKTALAYLANLNDLAGQLNPAMGRAALLPLWADLPTQGANPLYAQLFLSPSVLNNDASYDDPTGKFPSSTSDLLPQHQAALQGVLGLTADEVTAILADNKFDGKNLPAFSLANISLCYRYSMLAKCLGVPVADLISLKSMSGPGLDPFPKLNANISKLADDLPFTQTFAFVKQVGTVEGSGFTVEDLRYLLQHEYDPAGKYRDDPNTLMTLAQSIAGGLQQIVSQNTAPADLNSLSADLIEQKLSGLLPTPILKALFAVLTGAETYQVGMDSAVQLDPLLFAGEPQLTVTYDSFKGRQTMTYTGVLLDWKKSDLLAMPAIHDSPPLENLLASLLSAVQDQIQLSFGRHAGDVLGVWASLAQAPVVQDSPDTRPLVGKLLAMWTSMQSYEAQASLGAQIDPARFAANPEIQLTYDAPTQTQTLLYQGVLQEAERAQLAKDRPEAAALLQLVRDQSVHFFESRAMGLLTVTDADLDTFAQLFSGIDLVNKQKQLKAEMVRVFLPLLAQKLTRNLAVQKLAADLGSDASLVDALITDASLLADPGNPGKPLLGSVLALATQGVSAAFFDANGKLSAAGTAATADTADPANTNQAGTDTAHFEGYLQVPTGGSYRFFAMGNQNAEVEFQLDSPDPKALLKNPILSKTPEQHKNEVSQFVPLTGGLAYHFTVDFHHLGAGGASLLIQSENLAKGALSQVMLYPQTAVAAFTLARVLVSKVLQLVKGLGLDQRELSYAAQFEMKLSSLPTKATDDSAALFSQFLNLADYADLRKGPAGNSDGLIDVFANVGTPFAEPATNDPDTPWKRLADLTRRDATTVRAVAKWLGLVEESNNTVTAAPDFGNSRGIRRIWDALQLVQLAGMPVASLTAATTIASLKPNSPDQIAANLKNAVKARYTADAWRPVAQSVFDKLRRKKRDALVAFFAPRFENANQLFEYFLVDPGMEPVVQTSRLRLAISSVQTFVQRCLLNLENGNPVPALDVAPSAVDSDLWEWMKRYRVWMANRQFFLFPEDWMQLELRPDKTDLFEALESTLLQGDVTADLVEDAFFTYLKGLEVRARLDIVSMYLDQVPDNPASGALHVIARTYGTPHKYFYRTYADQSWSGWEAVTPDIEGDHMVVAVWRGRVNLFWLTFLQTAEPQLAPGPLNLPELAKSMSPPQQQIQVQLNWSEYFQSKWSNRVSTDVQAYPVINVDANFDPKSVFIHVTKEQVNGSEGAILIHLDFPETAQSRAFRVTSKNSDPDFNGNWQAAPFLYNNPATADATLHTGSESLYVNLQSEIQGEGTVEFILDSVSPFALLTCANPVLPPSLPSNDPLYQEAGELAGPFFYQDTNFGSEISAADPQHELTFFVQPTLNETSNSAPFGISPRTSDPNPGAMVEETKIVPQVPVDPNPPEPGGAYAEFSVNPSLDWVTDPNTAIAYGDAWIGAGGAIGTPEPGIEIGAPVGAFMLVGGQGLRVGQLQSKTIQHTGSVGNLAGGHSA